MANNKKAVEFERATIEEMEKHIPRHEDGTPKDDVEVETVGMGRLAADFDVRPQNVPSLSTVLSTLNEDERSLATDPRALENVSTSPCIESPVIRTETQRNNIEGASQIQAALETPRAMSIGRVPPDAKKQLADVIDAMKNLPTADAITYVDNRKMYMASEVRDVPNLLTKAQALKLIEALVGPALTAKVVICAMGTGFVAKPHVWLSQRLAYECSKREVWDKIEPIADYDEQAEVGKEAVVPKALTRVFSATVTEQLMVISRIRRISMLHAVKVMTEKACAEAKAEKAPKEYTERFESMPELEALIAAG